MMDAARETINCIHAHVVEGARLRYFECGNSHGPFSHKMVSNAYCARCKRREPLMQIKNDGVYENQVIHQMTLEDWIRSAE